MDYGQMALIPLSIAVSVAILALIGPIRELIGRYPRDVPNMPPIEPQSAVLVADTPDMPPDEPESERMLDLPLYDNPIDPTDGQIPYVNRDWEIPDVDYNEGADVSG